MHTPELPLSAEDVEAAARRLGPVLRRTPLGLSHRLSELTGVPVWLKREDLQAVGSYKLRGVHLFMDCLDAAGREGGVVVASGGKQDRGVGQGGRSRGGRR